MAQTENERPTVATAPLPADPMVDLTAASDVAVSDLPPEIMAQTLGQYLRAWLQRIRGGDSGVLPVVLGLIVVAIAFEIITPENAYLRPSNLSPGQSKRLGRYKELPAPPSNLNSARPGRGRGTL